MNLEDSALLLHCDGSEQLEFCTARELDIHCGAGTGRKLIAGNKEDYNVAKVRSRGK